MSDYAEKQKAKAEYVAEKTAEFEVFFTDIKKDIKAVIKSNNFQYHGEHCGYLLNDEVYKSVISISKDNKNESASYYMNLFDSLYEIARYKPKYLLLDIKVDLKTNDNTLNMYIIFIFKDK